MEEIEHDPLLKLQELLRKLRSPEGCPWDRQQDIADIGGYLLEEAYEVIEAIHTDDMGSLQEELGDLLFQILFIARIAEEKGDFNFTAVMSGVAEKMIRRHPHVFGDIQVKDVETIKKNWKTIKEKEGKKSEGLFEEIPKSMPALQRVQKITERASEVGFDWANMEDVIVKAEEEFKEFKDALKNNRQEMIREEMGDLLFSLVNLCRFLGINAEDSLRCSLYKFLKRFKYIEDKLRECGKSPDQVSLAYMDALWNQAKTFERDIE